MSDESAKDDSPKITRRNFLRAGLRGAAAIGLVSSVAAVAIQRSSRGGTVWQIDPHKCIQCGNCANYCVMKPSAVKCVHAYDICGYCKLCTGYLPPAPVAMDTSAENQLCPTGAIQRTFVTDPYYEYTIDEKLCIGCAKCVKGCAAFGNGSLFLQIRHDRCVNCNECSIAVACPAQAISRVPADRPYIIKGKENKTNE
ncbi:MAG: ferredoxin [Planctomycetaceae bacterium]|nr:MAG: ferredoxin [Planctomycetaceae bacterium]